MSKRLVFGILFIALMFFMLGVVSAATLNVCPACNDTTIQSAIDNSSASDIINVSAGTYTEDLAIPAGKNNLEIVGAGSATTTIKGVSSVDWDLFPLAIPNIEILSGGVKIHGFTIESPNYLAGNYTSGIVIGASNVEIYSNAFKVTNAATTDEISQGIQTYSSSAIPGVDISGLNIHDNTFTHLASNSWGYEAIYINPDAETATAYIQNNVFSGEVFRGITSERSRTTIRNNQIITDLAIVPDDWSSPGAFQGINVRRTNISLGVQLNVDIANNTVRGSTPAGGFNQGISLGKTGQTFASVNVRNNTLNYNNKSVLVKVANGLSVNYNNFVGNIYAGVENEDAANTLNAENNWYGVCNGPSGIGSGSGDAVFGNVDYTPWLGACINQKIENKGCYFVGEAVTLYANVSSTGCIGSVWFGINKGSGWQNYTGSITSPTYRGIGNYSYTLNSANFSGGETVSWTVYADDCNNNTIQDGTRTFYINRRSNVSVSPVAPNGLAGWYITEPTYTLSNPDLGANNMWYRWDGSGELVYTAPFGLADIPNPPKPESAGTLNLKYWSTICASILGANESMQNQTFYIDMVSPQFNTFSPENGSNTINNQRPTISVYIDELYGTNSGIKLSSVALALDGVNVSATVSLADGLDATATYTPAANLALGWHNVSVYAEDNSGHSNSTSWIFNLSLEAAFTTLEVVSPLDDTYYAGRAVPISVLVDGLVDLSYIDYFYSTPRWKTLCRDCQNYSGTKNFNDGVFDEIFGMADSWHNITIRAADANGNIMEENRYFFVDSKLPRVSKMLPSREKVVNGSYFFVKYHEDNLRNITLRYGNLLLNYNEKNLSNCPSGRNKNCSTSVNLASYENQSIEYWYDVADVVRTIQSRIVPIRVDTISPVMTIYNPNNASYGRYVYFNITISENAKKLEYYDQSESVPRWKRLCSNCNSYGFSKVGKKSFYSGAHNLIIRASDYAGNTDEEIRAFSVSY